MALVLGAASTDRVDSGSGASIDDLTAFTALAWLNYGALANDKSVVSKYRGALNQGWQLQTPPSGSSANLYFEATRATTVLTYVTNDTPLATGRWTFVAVTLDQAAGTPVHIYSGFLGTGGDAIERSYGTTNNGSGAFNADAARSLFWGNRDVASPTLAPQASFAFGGYIARVLDLEEIRQWQWEPSPLFKDSRCFHEFGVAGTGTSSQPDLTGNGNTGSPTGTTLGTHITLPSRRQVHTMAAHERAGSW